MNMLLDKEVFIKCLYQKIIKINVIQLGLMVMKKYLVMMFLILAMLIMHIQLKVLYHLVKLILILLVIQVYLTLQPQELVNLYSLEHLLYLSL